MKRFSYVLIGLLLVAGLAWWMSMHTARSKDTKLAVITSFYPMAEFTQRIGGTKVTVTTLIRPGVEPHDYEPTPRDVATLYKSKLFVYNGAGMEPWAGKLTKDLNKHGVTMVETTHGMTLRTVDGQPTSPTDPHVWLDPVLAIQQVTLIKNALVKADPTNAKDYEHNAANYIQKLHDLDEEFRGTLAHCQQQDIVTAHQAFGYLAAEYNLRVLPIAGLSPDDEPSPQKLAETADFVKAHNVRYIFFETLASPKLAQTIAQETGAKTLVFNPLEGLTDKEVKAGKSYISVQKDNIQALRTALHCQV